MNSTPHPRVLSVKGSSVAAPSVRSIVFAPGSQRVEWIEKELQGDDVMIQVARNLAHVIAALLDDPPPRPQILIIDFDAVSAGELLELHTIRESGWFGTIFAIGKVPAELRKSLRIQQVIVTLVDDALRRAVAEIGFNTQTRPLPVISL